MSTVTLTKKPARVSLPSCPAWCVRDHGADSDWRHHHRSEFTYADSTRFAVSAYWVEIADPTPSLAKFDRAQVWVTSGSGCLDLPRGDALELAAVLESLGRDEEARLVRDASWLIVGIGGAK